MNWLIERFACAGNRLAFVHDGARVAYSGMVDKISLYRHRIASEGVLCGEKVVVLGDYSPDFFCLILALAVNSNIIIPLTRDSVIEEGVALGVSGCDWFVEFGVDGVIMSFMRRRIDVSNELLDNFRLHGEPGIVLFSSGSSGRPKGILHNFNRVAEKFRVQRSSIVAIPFLMIDHFGGINTLLAITSSLGTVVSVVDRSIGSICRAIELYKVELLPATPSFLTILMTSRAYRGFDLSSLKRITYGTEVMPLSTLERLRSEFPLVVLQQTYGLSELGVLHSKSNQDGSLWVRLGGEGFQTKVINGILWVKSAYAMIGYLNAADEFDADGWFNTHDRVEVDGEYFRILGRETDLINVGGQKVYPVEVENIILLLDNIKDVAVFAEPSKLLGQIVVARVQVLREETSDELKKRIRAFCRTRLASYKIPVKVVVTDEDLYSARQKKKRFDPASDVLSKGL